MRTYHKNGRWYLEGMIRKKRFHKAIPEAVTKKDAENFSLMIARALQNAVSNSCENKKSAKLVELDVRDIFKNRKAAYKQGTQDLNAAYLNPNVENIAWEAQERGAKIDESLYPQTMSQQSIQVSRGV